MDNTNIKYSIIVLVYNVEAYLHECINSILNQTYSNCEVILVDDGSKDNCGKICDYYCRLDDRVKVLHKENGGRLSAWTAGLDIANGLYIGSIDGDDFIDQDMVKKIDEVVNLYSPDMVIYGYKGINDKHTVVHKYPISIDSGLYDRDRIVDVIYPSLINRGCFEGRSCIYLSRVNKFIKADLLRENSRFYTREIDYGEDNLWTIPNVVKADSIYVMSDYYPYNYRYNPDSITHSFNKNLWDKFVALDEHIIEILKVMDAEELVPQIYCDMIFHIAISINNIMQDDLSKKQKIRAIKTMLSNNYARMGLTYMDYGLCTFKERINLKLMKWKASHLIYYVKKIQKGNLKK